MYRKGSLNVSLAKDLSRIVRITLALLDIFGGFFHLQRFTSDFALSSGAESIQIHLLVIEIFVTQNVQYLLLSNRCKGWLGVQLRDKLDIWLFKINPLHMGMQVAYYFPLSS